MAGRNMAANLGMNIDWRLKDPGMFNRGIENFSRPDADPTNMEEMQGLLNWQQKMGREDAARTTLSQVEKLKAEQKETEATRQGQARSAALNELSKAIMTGDTEAIKAAKDVVFKVGEVQGVDMGPAMEGRMSAARAARNQAFTEQERIRIAQERQEDAAEASALAQLAAGMNAATTIEQADALLAKAPESAAEQAALLHNRATSRIDAAAARAEKEMEASAPIGRVEASIPEGIPPQVSSAYATRIKALNEKIDKANKNPSQIPNYQKQELQRERRNLESGLFSLADTVALADYRDQKSQDREYTRQIARIQGMSLPKKVVEEAMDTESPSLNPMTWGAAGDELSYEEAEEAVKQQMIAELNATYGKDVGAADGNEEGEREAEDGLVIGQVYAGREYLGGPRKDPNSWR